jgi:hypothetical protein
MSSPATYNPEATKELLCTWKSRFSTRQIFKYIRDEHADPNVRDPVTGNTILQEICILGQDDHNIKRFLDEFLDVFLFLLSRDDIQVRLPNAKGEILIHNVVKMSNPTFCYNLLMRSPDACLAIDERDGKGRTALEIAISNMKTPKIVIKDLLDAGAECKPNGQNLLRIAILHENNYKDTSRLFFILNKLLEHGADVNYVDCSGYTPLSEACSGGWTERPFQRIPYAEDRSAALCQFLLDQGANPYFHNNFCLRTAKYCMQTSAIKVLEDWMAKDLKQRRETFSMVLHARESSMWGGFGPDHVKSVLDELH